MSERPTADEVDEVIRWCCQSEMFITHFSGMTYEQGVLAAIEWMLGNADNPKGAQK